MGARKNFICGAPLASVDVRRPTPVTPHESVVRIGSLIEVWNPDSCYWVSTKVEGFRKGVGSLDGVLIRACAVVQAFGGGSMFVPWTLIR